MEVIELMSAKDDYVVIKFNPGELLFIENALGWLAVDRYHDDNDYYKGLKKVRDQIEEISEEYVSDVVPVEK